MRKATGLDQMPARLMRDVAAEICNPLTNIINVSLETGYVPREWKVARVVPLFKSGKTTDLDNYRPISISPVASKILEKVVHMQLYKYLTVCHHLSPYQCGFRKNHSTETAAIAFTDSVRRNMDQGLLTGAVFIDLHKAFDTIDQSVLLNKLIKYGVNDLELEWFNNYLTCRSQVVCLEDVASEQCQVLYGVPQGSILGPLLFVLFVNDLPSVFSKCQVLMYADDTVSYYTSQTVVEIEQILTDELACLHQWLQNNNLFLNVKKTECLLFGTAPRLSKVNDFTIKAGSSVLRRVVEFKYLGVIMDECLNWKAQASAVFSKASKRIGMLRRMRNDITVNAADKVYKSIILPMLDYSDTVWSCCNKGDAERLERLQTHAAKVVYPSSDDAMNTLRWTSLHKRREHHVLRLVKKSLTGTVPQFLTNYFTFNRDVHERLTRQSNQLHLLKVKTETAKKSFYHNGCIVYNSFIK